MDATKTDAAVQLADLTDVEILEFPCIDRKGRQYGVETADQLIETSAAFADRVKPPLVLGHNEADDGKITTGMPALGWGGALRKKVVGASVRLVTNLSQVPAAIADLINKGAYRRISGAFWPDGAEAGIPEAKGRPVLRHIGLLGADTPRIKTLADVQALYQPAQPPQAAFADSGEADVAEFADVMATEGQDEPQSLPEAIQAVQVAEDLEPLLEGLQSRVWVLSGDSRNGKSRDEVLAGLADLAAELSRIVDTLRASPAATPAEAATAAAMADPAGGTAVVEPPKADTKKTTATEPAKAPADTKVAAAGAAAGSATASAAAVDGPKPAAAAAPPVAAAAPSAGNIPAGKVEMSDSAKQTVETFITRKTAAGQLLPKHHPAIRAQACACFANGGDEAVASFVDDQAALRQAKVIDLGETGVVTLASRGNGGASPDAATAEFADADPAAVADAGEEFDRSRIGAILGVKRASFIGVRARAKR
jgi:hypothetical protein